jgi:hypothetical protein
MTNARALELGGRVLLAAIMGLIVLSYVWVYGLESEPGRVRGGVPVDVSGTIATYAPDALIVSTFGGERRTVHVTPATTVVEADAPATVADLRPGRSVAVQAMEWIGDGSVVARGILVWGGR